MHFPNQHSTLGEDPLSLIQPFTLPSAVDDLCGDGVREPFVREQMSNVIGADVILRWLGG
jgi:hypothetical protein